MRIFIDRLFYGNYWLATKTATFPFMNAIAFFGITIYLFAFWVLLIVNLFIPIQMNEENKVVFVCWQVILSLILMVAVVYFTNNHYKRKVNFLRSKRHFKKLKLGCKLFYALSNFILIALIFLLSFFI
jgi:hypothetical protein